MVWAGATSSVSRSDSLRVASQGTTSTLRKPAALAFLSLEESEEVAEMGAALQEAEIFFADQPEYRAMDQLVLRRFTRFLGGALPPGTSPSRVRFGAQLLVTVLESVGRTVAGLRLPRPVVARWARACAGMVADHLRLP